MFSYNIIVYFFIYFFVTIKQFILFYNTSSILKLLF